MTALNLSVLGHTVEEVRSEQKSRKAVLDSNIVNTFLRARKLVWKLQNYRVILIGDPHVEMVKA